MILDGIPKIKKSLARSNLSMPKINDKQNIPQTQFTRMMENFEKDARSNAQKIRELLQLENSRKEWMKKNEDKAKREKVNSSVNFRWCMRRGIRSLS
jgi:predicted HTH transcriptional regulator